MMTSHLPVLWLACCVIFAVRADVDITMMRAAQVKQPGDPDNLSIGQEAVPEPQEGEVLIKVKATAINRADTLQRRGQFPAPPGVTQILGLEASGVIAKIGPRCSGRWPVGNRVMALLAGGGNAEYVTCPEGQLMPIPANLDFVKAAAIPEVWITAFQLLHTIGKVQPNETVLIHGGGSGVGTAAIQLCAEAGAHPLVTAGSAMKMSVARGLGAVGAFNYKKEDVTSAVLKATDGKGVDIVLDCVGGSMYNTNVNVLAMDGRWIVCGLMGGSDINGDLFRKILSKRLTIIGSTLRSRSLQYKKELVENFSRLALPLFESEIFRPIIHTVLPLENLSEAHLMMEQNLNIGKIVLTVGEETDQDKQKIEL